MTRHWLLDFDDTLVSGPTTWGIQVAIPRFVKDNKLAFDQSHFAAAVLKAQEQTSQSQDFMSIVDEFFKAMQWPLERKDQLLDDLQHNYQPQLFDDTLAFLKRLQAAKKKAYVVSNNPRSPEYVTLLRLNDYIEGVFTPQSCPGSQPKPHRSLWDCIAMKHADVRPDNVVVVGDDPWSEAAFAEQLGLPCWIVDRDRRYERLQSTLAFQRVRTLAEIPITP